MLTHLSRFRLNCEAVIYGVSTIFQLCCGGQFFFMEEMGVPGEKPLICRKSLFE